MIYIYIYCIYSYSYIINIIYYLETETCSCCLYGARPSHSRTLLRCAAAQLWITSRLTAKTAADSKAAQGMVMIHVKEIFAISFKFSTLPLCAIPIKTTAPTWQCVEDTGRPAMVARTIESVEASSVQKTIWKSSSVRSLPTVLITRWPSVIVPQATHAPATDIIHHGVSFCEHASSPCVYPLYTAAKAAVELAVSFAPCANDSRKATKTSVSAAASGVTCSSNSRARTIQSRN